MTIDLLRISLMKRNRGPRRLLLVLAKAFADSIYFDAKVAPKASSSMSMVGALLKAMTLITVR